MPAYVKTIWATGDIITAAKNNNAELGIEAALRKDGVEAMTAPLNVGTVEGLAVGNMVGRRRIMWNGTLFSLLTDANAPAMVSDSDKADGFHFRLTSGLLEYSTDNVNWFTAGLPTNKVRAIARRN